MSSVRAYIVPPTGIQQSVKLNSNGKGAYVPDKYGMHEIVLEVNEDRLVLYSVTIFLQITHVFLFF